MSDSILTQGAGYGVITYSWWIDMGLFFNAVMVGCDTLRCRSVALRPNTCSIAKIQTCYTSHKTSFVEEFNSASRSVPLGLIAAGIISAWTWTATLLQSSAITYKLGISEP
nr:hypothetical protein L203_05883 [Cryptococcus depauperatus CBS 7841]